MAQLKVDLQAAFRDDAVQVTVDGETLLDLPSVTTDFSIGLAASAETTLEPGVHEVEVSLPRRSLFARTAVTVEDRLHVGVSAEEGEVTFAARREPFTYF